MNELFNHNIESDIEFKFSEQLLPVSIDYLENEPNKLELSNGSIINSPCLNCSDKPCMRFNTTNESNVIDAVFFPDVCPTDAMFLDEKEQVFIDEELCIGCGLCAYRCNTGAIYVSFNKMRVHRDQKMLIEGKLVKTTVSTKNRLFKNIDEKILQLRQSIRENKKSNYLLNNLIKSYFMSLGFKVIKPRAGDVNLRMDLIVENNDTLFLVEVDDLGSPDTIRDIIDDIAIFSDKYERNLSTLAGACCLLEFPNKRSEFYELISDVKKVLDINIYSLSLGVMLSILNDNNTLDITKFFINEKQTSCRTALESTLNRICEFPLHSNSIEAAK
ncbi:4Fe-4S binding protein [Providencia rettgeri]|uniref:4Fe-4S binding protein n=1 Tax=Providencia rettgeri TaxID=587 RepID=UPI0034E75136